MWAKVGQLLILCHSSLPSGQLMTHLGSDFPPGAGVLDVMYESPSTLLSCGYDTYVRYWDLRASVRYVCWAGQVIGALCQS